MIREREPTAPEPVDPEPSEPAGPPGPPERTEVQRRVARGRMIAFTTLSQAIPSVTLPALFGWLLRLTPAELGTVRAIFWLLVPAVAGVAAAVVGLGLRGVTRGADLAGAQAARRRVLAMPFRLALAVLALEAVALLALTAALHLEGAPLPLTLSVGLCSAALLALVPVPVFAFARVGLLPLALHLGDETAPPGRRLSLATQLGYSIVAAASAALVPAVVFGAAQLDAGAAADERARAQAAGVRLARAAEGLDVAAATTLVTRTPLSSGERTLLRAPSGTLLPEETAAELADLPYVEIPLTGALRGGALRVHYTARPLPRAPLMVVIVALLLVTFVVASVVGRSVAGDLRGVTRQIERVARDQDPGTPRPVATAEMRRVTRAANRLLDRVPRFTVESFLAIERAEEASRLKSQFLANMSHDLRSPLNSILGFSELLLRGVEGPITPRHRAELEIVQDRGNQLLRQLTEILDTAKVESAKMELYRRRAAPVELVRQAVQEARRGRPAHLADRLTVSLQPGMGTLYVDPLRVIQALTHLLNHAFDAEPSRLTLQAKEVDHRFVVELEHDAPLSDDAAARLFDAFRRVPGRSDLHLALPLARKLVELHGGTLHLASRRPVRLELAIPLR